MVLDPGSVLARVDIDDFQQLASDAGADPREFAAVLVGDYAADTDHPLHRAERGEVTLTEALDEVVFIDDQRGNVAAAARLGMRTIHAGPFDQIAGQLREHVEAWTRSTD